MFDRDFQCHQLAAAFTLAMETSQPLIQFVTDALFLKGKEA
jgi:hypothetical protein